MIGQTSEAVPALWPQQKLVHGTNLISVLECVRIPSRFLQRLQQLREWQVHRNKPFSPPYSTREFLRAILLRLALTIAPDSMDREPVCLTLMYI